MTTTWIYIEKDRVSQEIIDIDVFGSLRKLFQTKEVYIKGFKLPEESLRKLFKENENDFENEVYKIKKMKLKTMKSN